jgi:hypothetical protein
MWGNSGEIVRKIVGKMMGIVLAKFWEMVEDVGENTNMSKCLETLPEKWQRKFQVIE